MSRLRARVEREDGAILVLAAVLLIVLFGIAALAVDITLKSTDRQHLWNSADAAALAGASQLPDGLAAEAQANDFAQANDADMAGHVNTTFRCLVGDRNNDGQPDAGEIPGVCDPGPDVPASGPPWVCANGICTAPCVPVDGDKCNTIVLESDKTTDFAFAPAIGIDQGSTDIVSAACQGSCGAGFIGPVDLAIVLDRTGSMNDSNNSLQKAKQAALAVLNYFDPSQQHVALGVLGAGDIGVCNNSNPTNVGSRWLGVGLSSDYKDNPNLDVNGDGTPDVDGNSTLVQKINCLNFSSQGTNLGSPISDDEFGRPDVMTHLLNNGRSGVKKGIILLSDGAANEPDPERDPCRYAVDMATKAKNAGIEIFTIGFGVQGDTCQRDSGLYAGATVTRVLASMASNSVDNCFGLNPEKENTDGDHFFCEPKDGDLSDIFLQAAAQFVQGSKLVQLPPGG